LRRSERTITIPNKYTNAAEDRVLRIARLEHGQIQLAVAIEIAEGNRIWTEARVKVDRRLECAVAVASKMLTLLRRSSHGDISLPSPLKSPTTAADGDVPTG
jgi:hypothetical protein